MEKVDKGMVMGRPFRDRAAAGEALAARLGANAGRSDVLVLGLPRGGVPVAAVVAQALAAPLDGPAGQWAHELARAASERQAELGEAAAIEQPVWTAALGPVPDAVEEPAARAAWEARAGIEAGYRNLAGLPEDQVSLGAPPSRERPLEHAVDHQAAHGRGYQSDPEAEDVRVLSEAELYAVRERWPREQAWAPAYVADELAEAYQAAASARQEADLTAARLAQLPRDAEGREWVAAQHTIATRDAEAQLERAHQLEEIHQARAGWAQTTAPAEAADRDAALELERRGLPLQRAAARGTSRRAAAPARGSRQAGKRRSAEIGPLLAELLFDPHQLVVLRRTVRP